MSDGLEPIKAVDFAKEPDFRIGNLVVRPSTCRAGKAGFEERIEPRVMQVLVVLARAEERTVSREQLIDACWEGRVVSDDAIARVIAKVRQIGRDLDPSPFTLETVPKVGFRLKATASTSPVAELARATAGPTPGQTSSLGLRLWGRFRTTRRTVQVALTGLIAALAVAIALAAMTFGVSSQRIHGNGRVEVVQFEPLQTETELQKFSTLLSDAVVRGLSTNGVSTAARPSARGSEASANDAEFRVAGAVDRVSGMVVVNVQVLDRVSGVVLWSGQFQRAEVQSGLDDEIAFTIGGILWCALEERGHSRQPVPAEAFGLVLKICNGGVRGTFRSPEQSLIWARQLVEMTPNIAGAHGLHALASVVASSTIDESPREVVALRDETRRAIREALRLDPVSPKALMAQAMLIRLEGGSLLEQERALKQALTAGPLLLHNRIFYADFLRSVGRIRAAREAVDRNEILAASRTIFNHPPKIFLRAIDGNLESAWEAIAGLRRINPEGATQLAWTILVWWEEPRTALERLPEFKEGVSPSNYACFQAYLTRLISETAPDGLPEACASLAPDWRIRLLARQGDIDGAYALLARGLPNSRRTSVWLFNPEMRAFRHDPRFIEVANGLKLVDYWVQSDQWPDFCADPELPYDCRARARAVLAQR